MVKEAHERDVALGLIEPGKPSQNDHIESFNGRLLDKCLNEHWLHNGWPGSATLTLGSKQPRY